MLVLKRLNKENEEKIKKLFYEVFTKEPWYDDWHDIEMSSLYIKELTQAFNSLALGLYLDNNLIGISLGSIMHFYEEIQYRIDELCIAYKYQNKGYGSSFMKMIDEYCLKERISYIILSAEREYQAFNFYLKNNFKEAKQNVMLYKKNKIKL